MADLAKKLIQNHQVQPQDSQIETKQLIHSHNININLADICDNPKNRQIDMDKVKEYAESIQTIGLIENPVVTPIAENPGKYMILSGHHRIAACRRLAESDPCYDTVCCKVMVSADEIDAELILLHGNIKHNPLTAYEKMMAIGREEELLKLKNEKGTLRKVIAVQTGLKSTQVQTNLTVYKKAIPEVKLALKNERISLEKARDLAMLPADEQLKKVNRQSECKSAAVSLLEKNIREITKIENMAMTFVYKGLTGFPLNNADQKALKEMLLDLSKYCRDYLKKLSVELEEFEKAQTGQIECNSCEYKTNMNCGMIEKYGNEYMSSDLPSSGVRPWWCPRIKY